MIKHRGIEKDGALVTRRVGLKTMAAGALVLGPARSLMAGPRKPPRPDAGAGYMALPPAAMLELVNGYMAATQTPGVVVGWVDAISPMPKLYVFGKATDAGAPVTLDTEFGIGSVTKTFTGLLLAALNGSVVHLTDPVTDYLSPWLPAGQGNWIKKVTLGMLATHSSSFPNSGPSGEQVFTGEPPAQKLIDWWKTWPAKPKDTPAQGTRYAYSNLGMTTLAFALVGAAKKSGKKGLGSTYNELLQNLICKPISGLSGLHPMTATAPDGYLPATTTWAEGHVDGKTITTHNRDLNSTPWDLYSYVAAQIFYSGSTATYIQRALGLSQQVAFTMPACQPKGFDMGLGWQIWRGSPTVFTKDGGTTRGGCGCWIGHCPTRSVGIFVMANKFGSTNGQGPSSLGKQLLAQFGGVTFGNGREENEDTP